MVNFRDPDVIMLCFGSLSKLWHAMYGLYIWEFFTTIDYEWSVIRGRRPYGWSIWIYSFTRAATLLAIILNMTRMNIMTPVNCQVWVRFELALGYMAFAAASLSIVLRIIAIWDKNKVITAIALGVWGINIVSIIQGIVRIRHEWAPAQEACVVLNPFGSKLNIISMLVTDISLLITMLVGLFRLRGHRNNTFHLGRFLWKQGVVWLFLATVAEVTPVVFIGLNLNDPLDIMFQVPALIIMSIAATRMHRSLADHVSESTNTVKINLKYGGRIDTNETSATRRPGNQVEVITHKTRAQYPTTQSSCGDSNVGVDGRLDNEYHRQSLNNAESSV